MLENCNPLFYYLTTDSDGFEQFRATLPRLERAEVERGVTLSGAGVSATALIPASEARRRRSTALDGTHSGSVRCC